MQQLKLRLGVIVRLTATLFSVIALAGNYASAGSANSRLFVPDQGNNRVLIYNHPATSGQRADVVLGQSSFTTATSGTSATTMSGPLASAADEDGNLYVSDSGNCRVLRFRAPFTDGETANLVIGKPDANTSCGSLAASASNLGTTGGVAIDDDGNLWVADAANNRVLRFEKPLKTGEAADVVIGQPDFVTTSCISPPSAATLCRPEGLAFDSDNLWVADGQNNRVLEFKSPNKGTSASVELGHPAATAFTSSLSDDGGVSASALFMPVGIGFDEQHRLWVADSGNNRALRFNPGYKNGNAATLVLGQAGFTSRLPNQNGPVTAATLSSPQGIALDRGGDVWVGDTSNNRTLHFEMPGTTGENASIVLGQLDFTHNLANQSNVNPSDETQKAPFNAGPSLIALAVLAGLAGGREWLLRLQRRS